MKKTLLLLLGATLFFLFVIAFERPDFRPQGDASHELFFPDFDFKKVSRVEYDYLVGGIELIFGEDEVWRVAEHASSLKRQLTEKEGAEPMQPEWFEADEALVKQAVSIIGNLEAGILVSSKKDKQAL